MTFFIEVKTRPTPDEQKIMDYLIHHGFSYTLFSPKQLERKKVILPKDAVVFGGLKSVFSALNTIGIPHPIAANYPPELQAYYHRKIWSQPLKQAIDDQRSGKDYFIKPRHDFKSFTGFCLQDAEAVKTLNKAFYKYGLDYPIDCSEIVKFDSEYRVFVVNGKVGHISHYWGKDQVIDAFAVGIIVEALVSNPVYYNTAIDIGVLDTGELAVIEHNAFFSIDSYDAPPDVYASLLINGWKSQLGLGD